VVNEQDASLSATGLSQAEPEVSALRASIPSAADDWKWRNPRGLEAAIIDFKLALPGWWFTVGECQVSADASCGPTRESVHLDLIKVDKRFDDGFHADLPQPASMADALRDVMAQAMSAIEAADA
jgi:hypothetical protein